MQIINLSKSQESPVVFQFHSDATHLPYSNFNYESKSVERGSESSFKSDYKKAQSVYVNLNFINVSGDSNIESMVLCFNHLIFTTYQNFPLALIVANASYTYFSRP